MMKRIISIFVVAVVLPLASVADTIWMSAADVTTSDAFVFPVSRRGVEANSERLVQLQTFEEGPHQIQLSFSVKKAGWYSLWCAATPQDVEWASPFRILLDGKPIAGTTDRTLAMQVNPPAFGLVNNPGLFQWYGFGRVNLSAGEHTIVLRIDERRQVVEADGQRAYAFFFDSLLLIEGSGFVPSGPDAKNASQKRR